LGLAFLRAAELVITFAFEDRYNAKIMDMDALLGHLKDHGISARVETWPDTGDMDAVSALFACLDSEDIDLIVAGAYGHSRCWRAFSAA
jgi:hypothetical protein